MGERIIEYMENFWFERENEVLLFIGNYYECVFVFRVGVIKYRNGVELNWIYWNMLE